MAVCDTCGNDYDKTFTITRGQEAGTFDSFECVNKVSRSLPQDLRAFITGGSSGELDEPQTDPRAT